jgi:hypothetical protein
MGIDLWFDETRDSAGATNESDKYGAFGSASPSDGIVHDFVSRL